MRLVRALFVLILLVLLLLTLGVLQNAPPLSEPPGTVVRLYTYIDTNVAETAVGSPFPELRPRQYTLAPEALYAKVREAIERLPRWEIIESSETRRELRAVVTSRIFRFKDDVTVVVVAKPDGRPMVTLRSASRVGRGDLAANARHILDFYEMLERVGAHGDTERVAALAHWQREAGRGYP